MPKKSVVVFFMIFHSGNCYSESTYYIYDNEDKDYQNDGNFSYKENQQNVNKKVKV